jgi:hypothetical protein
MPVIGSFSIALASSLQLTVLIVLRNELWTWDFDEIKCVVMELTVVIVLQGETLVMVQLIACP